MLDGKDLELIAQIVTRAMEPLHKDMAAVKMDVSELRNEVTELRRDVTELQKDMAAVKMDISELRSDVSVLQKDMTAMQNQMSEVQSDVKELKQEVKDLHLTLENEVNTKIRIIAEGHLDLSRKLDEALKIENEKEMLFIRVSSLENDVRRLKTRDEEIA